MALPALADDLWEEAFAPSLLEARDEHFKDDTGPPADGIGAA
jgi:hypothetical protein